MVTILASEPDPGSSERAGDAVAACGDRLVAGRGDLRLVAAERDDPHVVGAARRLRTAPSVQLELVSGWEDPRPGVVWVSLPEQAREQVLVLLARLIGSGAVEGGGR